MRLYGSLSRLVSLLFRKDSQDITLRPNQSTTYTAARDFQFPPGDSTQVLVSASSVQTLTNKTFDADGTGNSITNIENADIKAGAAIDATKIADGSVSNTEFQYLDGVTSSIQTQLNSNATGLSNHLADAVDAHDASAISSVPSGNLAATDVQAALNELQTDVDTRATSAALTSHTGASSGVHGVTGSVVGTTDTQTLSNKTFTTPVFLNNTGVDGIANQANLAADASGQLRYRQGLNQYATLDGSLLTTTGRTYTFPDVDITFAGRTNIETLTNKTLTTPLLDRPRVDQYFDIDEEAAPATPSAGQVRVYAKTDKKLYRKGSDGIEQEVGSGTSSAINYVANPQFVDGTVTGWATYADAAATTPADGTGGSPNVTFTAVSGGTVRGTFAGRLTKDAANRQGQGVSYAFTLDAVDTGRPVSFSFDFVAGGSYVAGDVGFYIYDVTNSQLITPSVVSVPAGKGTLRGFFVATTGTSYRLIMHVASTNASAWTLDTDNFNVGPQRELSGAAVTDWQSFTPTVRGGSTDVSSEFTTRGGRWRRVGDSMLVNVYLLRNGSAASAPGDFRVDIPDGKTCGPLPNNRLSGDFKFGGSSANLAINSTEGLTTVGVDSDLAITALAYNNTNFPPGHRSQLEFIVPIANWSSNTTALTAADPEFASHDGTNIVRGIAGALIPTTTPATAGDGYDITSGFSSYQSTDTLTLEVQLGGTGKWIRTPSLEIEGLRFDGTSLFGATADANSSGTVEMVRGKYRRGTTDTWASLPANSRWRVRKQSGQTTGILPVSTAAVVGRTDGLAPAAGTLGEPKFTSQTLAGLGANPTGFGASTSLTAGIWMVKVFGFFGVVAPTKLTVSLANSGGSIINDVLGANTSGVITDAGNTGEALTVECGGLILRPSTTTTYTVAYAATAAAGGQVVLEFSAVRIA